MTDALAIMGFYSDFKFVKTRKACQIVIEIPSDQSAHALKVLGGMPDPAAERPVAIAMLNTGSGSKTATAPKSEGQTCVRMAHAMCKDGAFQVWVSYEKSWRRSNMTPEQNARDFILDRCLVTSRGDFAVNPAACEKLRGMKADFDHRDSRR